MTQPNTQKWQLLIANVNTDSQHSQSVAEQFAQQLQRDHHAYKNGIHNDRQTNPISTPDCNTAVSNP